MKASLEMRIKQENWQQSAIEASNLSELYLILGDVAKAQKYGAQSVDFANSSGDDFWKEVSRCKKAGALHQVGKYTAAEKLFIEAEKMQEKRAPDYPYLYSLRGFQYCDLLLSMGKYAEVLERAQYAINIETTTPLTDFGFNNHSIGKALMLQSIENNSSDFAKAEAYLNQAVDGLREAGTQDLLPYGLLARASLYRHQKDFPKSWADLDEIREIAEYGQTRLHLTDYHLEACRVISEQLKVNSKKLKVESEELEAESRKLGVYEIMEHGETLQLTKEEMQMKFQEHFETAERLVEETGYHRRDGELEELRNISFE